MRGDIPFTVTFQNYNPYQITVDVQINIYNDLGGKVATLSATPVNIASESSDDITVNWDSLNETAGSYTATATVTVGSNRYSSSSPFAITCYGNFDGDQDVDADDVRAFLADFGRNQHNRPCTDQDLCKGDFDCDGDVDATDVPNFLNDFGCNQYNNPCPVCEVGDWCVYP
jgi:hypothetical protein